MTYRVVQWTTGNVGKQTVQAIVDDAPLVIEIPRYTINYAKEKH